MDKEFVPYEPALELKELGFDEPCFGYYEPNGDFNYIESNILKDFPYLAKNSEWKDLCGAPTFSQTFRWFRENHDLFGIVQGKGYNHKRYYIHTINDEWHPSQPTFDIYEEAELACLRKLIEIVKNK